MPEDNKNKFICWECEARVEHIEHHHPVPRSRGGNRTIPLCSSCHSKAHHRKKNMNIGKLIADGIKQKKASEGVGFRWGSELHKDREKSQSSFVNKSRETRQKKAKQSAQKIVSIIRQLEAQGITSRKAQCEELKKRGHTTARGCQITKHTISKAFNTVERLESKYNK